MVRATYKEEAKYQIKRGVKMENTVANQVKEIKKTYNTETKDFKEISICTVPYMIDGIGKKLKAQCKDLIEEIDNGADNDFVAFKIKTDNYFIVSDYYPITTSVIMIMFYNDKKYMDEIFKNQEFVAYKKGNYNMIKTMNGYGLMSTKINKEDPPTLNKNIFDDIILNINKFFEKKDFYKKNNITHKRGLLFFGPPGTGKTSMIKQILRKQKDSFNIIIDATKEFDSDINDFLKYATGKEKKIIVFEDVDGLNMYSRSAFLNFLDGVNSLENTVVIATSNSVEKIDKALLNRPSRFDKMYYMGVPNEKSRETLILKFFPDLTKVKLEESVKLTKGFSGAYFKELFILTQIQECEIKPAIEVVRDQMKIIDSTEEKDVAYMG